MKQSRFGCSIAGLILEELLNTHNIQTRNVGAMINDLHSGLNFLYYAPDRRVYDSMWNLWRQDFKKRALALCLPETVETYLINTIVGLCRQKRREYMINRGNLGKRKKAQLLKEYRDHYNNFVKRLAE